MKDLQLVGGDLRPAGRGFATVSGTAYITQRIGMALAEPYGSDPYHTTWGSVLDSYLGQPTLTGTPALVSSEVSRVLQQIIDAQQQAMKNYVLTGARSQFAAADVIASVDSVNAAVSADPQTVQVSVALTTSSGGQVIVTRTVSNG